MSPARVRTGQATTSTRSTGQRRRSCPRRRAATSSSCASASPKKRRRSSSSVTGVRRCRASVPPLPWLDKPHGDADRRRADPRKRRCRGRLRRLPRLRGRRAALAAAERRAEAHRAARHRLWSSEYGGPPDWLERSVDHLAAHPRAVTPGTFVFVLSDFVPSPSHETVARRDRASLGRRSGRHPGSDLGAELSGRERDRRPASRSAHGPVSPVRLRRKEAAERRADIASGRRRCSRVPPARHRPGPRTVERSRRHPHRVPVWTDLRRTRRVIGA